MLGKETKTYLGQDYIAGFNRNKIVPRVKGFGLYLSEYSWQATDMIIINAKSMISLCVLSFDYLFPHLIADLFTRKAHVIFWSLLAAAV